MPAAGGRAYSHDMNPITVPTKWRSTMQREFSTGVTEIFIQGWPPQGAQEAVNPDSNGRVTVAPNGGVKLCYDVNSSDLPELRRGDSVT